MAGSSFSALGKRRLRLWLGLFFLALAVPTGVLIAKAYNQLRWETFHQHRVLAEELAARIDARFVELIAREEARSFSDYAFLNVAGDPAANFLQRSPLSAFPVESAVPGLIGYFQVDAGGAFSTPLLPAGVAPDAYGISGEALGARLALEERLQRILSENRLVSAVHGRSARKDVARVALPRDNGQRSLAEPQALPVPGAPSAVAPARDIAAALPAAPAEEVEVAVQMAASSMPEASSGAAEAVAVARGKVVQEEAPVIEASEPEAIDLLSPAAFDELDSPARSQSEMKQVLGRVEDLKLDAARGAAPKLEARRELAPEKPALLQKKRARKERSVLPEPRLMAPSGSAAKTRAPSTQNRAVRIHTFESEVDPFELRLLDSGHLVLFRKVWREGERTVQGALIDREAFLGGVIQAAFRGTALSRMSDLIVAYNGDVLAAFSGTAPRGYLTSAAELGGALLYRTRLSAPLADMDLIFSIRRLPPGPGASVITWTGVTLALVLVAGFYLMYRLGSGQIALARQQRDFVSAVSHELKTPLTSIRMYGEMLREGWAPEDKKQTYYDYIHAESERLSRLIGNVLELARMTRGEVHVNVKPIAAGELMDNIRSKVSSQIEHAGFTLRLRCHAAAGEAIVDADADAFAQIVINLVDNALKFSARASEHAIDIGCRCSSDGTVQFAVRDYGPGVPRDQMKQIFKLFYRAENELTRETVGTGIGLALAHQLALAMHAKLDVVNKDPGAEFRVSFPASIPAA